MQRGDLMQIQNGDARTYSCKPLADADTWHVLRQVAQGLQYLHHNNIVHGDIKPQNLLADEDHKVKIADFGISKMLMGEEGEKLGDTAGTPAFMSPQLCGGKAYSGQLADVWALGATMYMLRFGTPPFLAKKVPQLYFRLIGF